MNNIISIRDAALTYQARNGEVEALGGVSFDVAEGEFVSIVGPSGCGKSTLLGVLAGLETLDGGAVSLYDQPVTGASGRMGFMPQRDQLFEWRSIRDNVMLGLQIRRDRDPAHRDHVETLLKRYDLSEFAVKRPDQLSGGMRQRCALIRTLATGPDILLLDEPFSALDYQTRLAVSGDIWRIIRSEGDRPAGDPRHFRGRQHVGSGGGAVPAARHGQGGVRHGRAAADGSHEAAGKSRLSPVFRCHMEGAGAA